MIIQCVVALGLCVLGVASEPSVRSFDCFDTLVGRFHGEPSSIFRSMEESIPCPGFVELRRQAEANAADKSFKSIYEELQKKLNISDEQRDALRAMEFREELRNVFPICRNLSQVRDGDLIVSDTYYNEQEVREILQAAGLRKPVSIVATYNGKSSGQIWTFLQERFHIESHIGDNAHSDVSSPLSHGIPAKLFSASEYSAIEKDMLEAGQGELARFMRALRLQNPYAPDSEAFLVWNEQAELNLPILIMCSQYLDAMCREKKYDTVLFSQRGCCHWMPVFKALFPSYRSVNFAASRIMYNDPSPEYLQYIRSLDVPGIVIVDEQGTGHSINRFFQGLFSRTPPILYIASTTSETPGITHNNQGDSFELLNEDRIGTLIGFDRSGPVRAPLEFDRSHVDPAFACVELGIHLFDRYHFRPYDEKALTVLMNQLYKYTPVFKAYHVEEHSGEVAREPSSP